MATCISRRACADRNTFRLTNSKGETGKHIWTEFRCPNAVSKENDICVDCSIKLPKYKYQANQKCNHGQVGGPYPADSKLYGSAYYLKEIKAGWSLLEADEVRAKAAVDKASMGRKKVQPVSAAVEQPVVEQPVVEQPVVEQPVVEKKKRAYNRKKPLASAETKTEDPPAKTVLPKLKTPRAKKTVPTQVLLPEIAVVENPLEPKFIEVVAPPITITECVVVKVKKLKCQGKDYYYDSASGKVYGISVNGVGAYKGRYKEEDDMVDTTFPDSDEE
jgi:hypothetical protein